MNYLLGFGIPVSYFAIWTLTARTLFRRYRLIEGEKRNCPGRKDNTEIHRLNSKPVCRECAWVNKQWWQGSGTTSTVVGLTDANLIWDCIIQSVLWPITLPIWIMIISMTANPPPFAP